MVGVMRTRKSRRVAGQLLGAVSAVCLLASCGEDNSAELEAAAASIDELSGGLESAQLEAVAAEQERTELAATLLATESDLEAAVGRNGELEAERDEMVEARDKAEVERDEVVVERDQVAVERDAAIAERDDALREVGDLEVRFDPEIQAAIAGAQQLASDAACVAADSAGYEGAKQPAGEKFAEQALAGLPEGAVVDVPAIDMRISECFEAGEQRSAAEVLKEPKRDGIWTVGLEIAAGKWRSSGTGDDCYWQRSPDGQPDSIIDNHFGNAGGSVTLRAGEEFETTRCGTWEYAS